mgnify:CR=1 FL=1
MPGATKSNEIFCFRRAASVFLSSIPAARELQVKVIPLFARFLRKKSEGTVPGAWCWRCQRVEIYNSGEQMAYFCGIFERNWGQESCLVMRQRPFK